MQSNANQLRLILPLLPLAALGLPPMQHGEHQREEDRAADENHEEVQQVGPDVVLIRLIVTFGPPDCRVLVHGNAVLQILGNCIDDQVD